MLEDRAGRAVEDGTPAVYTALRDVFNEAADDLADAQALLAEHQIMSAEDAVRCPSDDARTAWTERDGLRSRLWNLAHLHDREMLPANVRNPLNRVACYLPEPPAGVKVADLADLDVLDAVDRGWTVRMAAYGSPEHTAARLALEAAAASQVPKPVGDVLNVDGRTQAGLDNWAEIRRHVSTQ